MLALTVLAIAYVFVMVSPYYLKNIIPNFQNYLHIGEINMSTLILIIGLVISLNQLSVGLLAYKFSSRKMLSAVILLTVW